MGKIFKIGAVYYVEFQARGLLYQQIAGENEEHARVLLESIEEKIRCGEMETFVRDVPLAVFLKDFNDFAARHYPPKTALRLRTAARHFFNFMFHQYPSVVLFSNINPKMIEDYKFFLKREKHEPWLINFTLLLVKEIFEYAIKTGCANDNPALHIRFVPDGRSLSSYLNLDLQAQNLLEKGMPAFRLAKLKKWGDVLRVMPYFRFFRDPV